MATDLTINQDSTIKQANKLIESVYRMDAHEQKIILLAIKQVYEIEKRREVFNERTEVIITGANYANEYDISRQAAFEIIRDAKNTLYERSFEYDLINPQTGEVKTLSSRWIHAKGETKAKSEISIFFASAVIPFIYLVQKEFTLLDLQEIGRLKNKYAIRLYQLLMKWRNAEYQPKFEYFELRDKLGLEVDDYTVMADFKKRVIDIAVKQINTGTGFVDLKYKTLKKGVKITHFVFSYTRYENDNLSVNTNNSVKKQSDADQPQIIDVTPKSPPKASRKTNADKPQAPVGELVEKSKVVRNFDFGMSQAQAHTFAHKIIKKIEEKDPQFVHIGNLSSEGETMKSFYDRIVIDFLAGSFKEYAQALNILGYKHHNNSADSQLKLID